MKHCIERYGCLQAGRGQTFIKPTGFPTLSKPTGFLENRAMTNSHNSTQFRYDSMAAAWDALALRIARAKQTTYAQTYANIESMPLAFGVNKPVL